jgi:CRP-like cAMP-binding protein
MIKKYLRSFKLFTEEQIDEFVRCTVSRQLNKNECFSREGVTCNEVAFIKSGIFRSYYISNEGEEITYCFRFPDDLLTAYSSFITGNPSVETLQAISSAELLVIKKYDIKQLVDQDHNWTVFSKIMAEQQYLELEQRVFQLQKNSATERYTQLLKNHPEYVQQLPLHYLASYLGITQRHLSRIRKEISI